MRASIRKSLVCVFIAEAVVILSHAPAICATTVVENREQGFSYESFLAKKITNKKYTYSGHEDFSTQYCKVSFNREETLSFSENVDGTIMGNSHAKIHETYLPIGSDDSGQVPNCRGNFGEPSYATEEISRVCSSSGVFEPAGGQALNFTVWLDCTNLQGGDTKRWDFNIIGGGAYIRIWFTDSISGKEIVRLFKQEI